MQTVVDRQLTHLSAANDRLRSELQEKVAEGMDGIDAHGSVVAGTDYTGFKEPYFNEPLVTRGYIGDVPPHHHNSVSKTLQTNHRTRRDDADEQDFNDSSLTCIVGGTDQ